MGKILVPVDGSQFMERVVSEGCQLAVNYQLDIVLINVQSKNSYGILYDNESLEGAEEKRHLQVANDILDKASEMAVGYAENTKIEKVARIGNVAEEIINVANEEDVDLIVIGSRGMSDIRRFFLGGVSTKVVAHAQQSVLVVK